MKSLYKAFTLIELLIVVAIIAILAAIAVPNFLEAQVRAKVARASNDLRTLAIGVESYAVDTNSYPMHMLVEQTNGNQQDPWIAGHPQYGGGPAGGLNGFHFSHRPETSLTTPVAYISSYPLDPFFVPGMPVDGPDSAGQPTTGRNPIVKEYLYSNSKHAGNDDTVREMFMAYGAWRMWTGGPGQGRRDIYFRADPRASMVPYDPTNGSVSRGAIWRTQRNPDGGRPIVPGRVE